MCEVQHQCIQYKHELIINRLIGTATSLVNYDTGLPLDDLLLGLTRAQILDDVIHIHGLNNVTFISWISMHIKKLNLFCLAPNSKQSG